MLKNRKTFFIIILIAALLYLPPALLGCGPFSNEAVFSYKVHPDLPLDRFAAGRLGVLKPAYARSYLYAAYRYLAGKGFKEPEQKALLELWNQRLKGEAYAESAGVKSWLEARNSVSGVEPLTSVDPYRTVNTEQYYLNYLNCPDEAFLTAAKTLNERIKKFGAGSAEVKDWVQAQDQVFSNCSSGESIPQPAKAGANPLIKADRDYQIATANFYAGKFDSAEKMYGQIARDNSSPWKPLAPYLVARIYIRKATLVPEVNKIDRTAMAQAETQLKKVLADKEESALYPSSRRLLSFVRLRLNPEERLRELAGTLTKDPSENLKQDLWDYTTLLDKFGENTETGFPDSLKQDELTDWILTFQATDQKALEHSIEQWEKSSSLPWFVAAISKVEKGNPKLPNLLEASEKIKSDSPAFESVTYHRIRLLTQSGERDKARQEIDNLLSKSSSLQPSSLNLYLGQRMNLARNLNEFLKYAQRVPVLITINDDGLELPDNYEEGTPPKAGTEKLARFDDDSALIMNRRMPLALLKEAAANKSLPEHLRREIAIAAWTRAVLLDDEARGKEIVPILESLIPEIKENLKEYTAATDPEARRFAGINLMLKFPGMDLNVTPGLNRETPLKEIDSFRDNWWCALDEKTEAAYPDFLSPAEKAATDKEQKRLLSLGTAPNYLSNQVVEFGKKNPDDPRVAEALHLAVRSTRFGCTDDNTTKFSKAAFQFLHKQYPQSEWAKKTKYYF